VVLVSGCGGSPNGNGTAPPPPAGFSQVDLSTGTGTQAGKGAHVTVKYTGWIYDAAKPDSKGTRFDSTDDHGPFEFTLGVGEVIPGWDQGFNGMRVGGKRRLIIPPNLGYGNEGTPGGPIPPGAGLVFDVELVNVR
jgi:FKBP-type peptidyl-prolyl cis-trans isomerase FkpA